MGNEMGVLAEPSGASSVNGTAEHRPAAVCCQACICCPGHGVASTILSSSESGAAPLTALLVFVYFFAGVLFFQPASVGHSRLGPDEEIRHLTGASVGRRAVVGIKQ